MKRREFIGLIGGAAAWPVSGRTQHAMPVIGFLGTGSAESSSDLLQAFRKGLSETGFREGRNVAIEYRWGDGQYGRLPALATDLVSRQVDVLVAPGSGPAALAAKAATTTIPIVFRLGIDPVEAGLVASLNRPGGNLTGVATLAVGLGPKRLELMPETTIRDLQAAARELGLKLHIIHAATERDDDAAFASLIEQRPAG
jgi:putative ABC transport system substrate-binding protein